MDFMAVLVPWKHEMARGSVDLQLHLSEKDNN